MGTEAAAAYIIRKLAVTRSMCKIAFTVYIHAKSRAVALPN